MHTLAIVKYLAEMPHGEAFHRGPHYLLRQTRPSKKEIHFYWEPRYIQWTILRVLYQYHRYTLTLNALMTQTGLCVVTLQRIIIIIIIIRSPNDVSVPVWSNLAIGSEDRGQTCFYI